MSDYYPPVAFHFEVSFAGMPNEVFACQEVSGLEEDHDVVTVKEGGENSFAHRLPGRVKSSNLILKQGLIRSSSGIFKWLRSSLDGDLAKPIEPKELVVSLLDAKSQPQMSWIVSSAWPVKLAVGDLGAMKNELTVESMELAYATMTRKVSTGRA